MGTHVGCNTNMHVSAVLQALPILRGGLNSVPSSSSVSVNATARSHLRCCTQPAKPGLHQPMYSYPGLSVDKPSTRGQRDRTSVPHPTNSTLYHTMRYVKMYLQPRRQAPLIPVQLFQNALLTVHTVCSIHKPQRPNHFAAHIKHAQMCKPANRTMSNVLGPIATPACGHNQWPSP
jgi:hypothetical protein